MLGLALIGFAMAQPAPTQQDASLGRVRPEDSYLNCLRLNVSNLADDAAESEWQAGWRQSLSRCRENRMTWWRYYFLGNPTQRDRANAVEWQLMQIEAEAYRRYRSPIRMQSYQHIAAAHPEG